MNYRPKVGAHFEVASNEPKCAIYFVILCQIISNGQV